MRKNNKKINILVPIRRPVGGIRTYLKYTHRNLDRNSYEYTFLVPTQLWQNRLKEDFDGRTVNVVCSRREESSLSMLSSLFFLLKNHKYHLIHSQGLTAGIISVIANMLFGLPHITTLHQVFGEGYSIDTFFDKYTFFKKYLVKKILQKVNIIQTVGEDARENLLKFFPGLQRMSEKIVTIQNGIDIKYFDNLKENNPDLFRKKDDIFYIGFIGRYMPHKGFDYVIDSMDILVNDFREKNIRVINIGGSSGFLSRYQRKIEKRGLTQYFEFLDFFPNISPLLEKIDVLLMPSLAEACPLLPMEALVTGTPVIAFSSIGLREVLKDTPAKMVSVGDVYGLVDSIVAIRDAYSSIKTEFDYFVPVAKERFDVKKTVAKLNEIFLTLAKNEK